MKRLTEKREKRWGIESPEYGLILFGHDTNRERAARYLKYENGRRLVRVTITWRGASDSKPSHTGD